MDPNISQPTYSVYRPGEAVPGGQTAPNESRQGALWDSGGITYQWSGGVWNPLRATTTTPTPISYPSITPTSPTTAATGSYPDWATYITPIEKLLPKVQQSAAGQQLNTFYTQVLQFAKGDLDLAKRIIQYTYESGIRESQSDYELQARQQKIDFPKETGQLQTTQNQRGILQSGFGGTERQQLLESQNIRREAADRALKQREETLSKTKTFGEEKEAQTYAKTYQDIGRQKEQDFYKLAQDQSNLESQKYQAEVGKYQFQQGQEVAKQQLDLMRK